MIADDPCDVRSLGVTYRTGHDIPTHRHGWAQLLHARSGLLRVTAEGRVWLVPPTRAIWLGPGVAHGFAVKGEAAFRSLYFSGGRAAAVGRSLGVVEISALLGELVAHVFSIGALDPTIPEHDRLAGVIVDQIRTARAVDTALPLPRSTAALRLAEHFQASPCDDSALTALAAQVGASLRTLQRRFTEDTGLTIEAWRQKARLIASTASLAEGRNVTLTAFDCGYHSPSAYIAAFKRQFGITPRRYAKNRAMARI